MASQLKNAMNDTMPQFDLKTGQIKQKKVPKQKSPEENTMKELKTLLDKPHGYDVEWVCETCYTCLSCFVEGDVWMGYMLCYPRVTKMRDERLTCLDEFEKFGVRNCSELAT